MSRFCMVSTINTMQKKFQKKQKYFFWPLLLLNLFREGAHMGKIRLEKKMETEKNGEND